MVEESRDVDGESYRGCAAYKAKGNLMAVLSKKDIQTRMGYLVSDDRSLIVTPLLDDRCFDQDSVDLRLGTHFLLPQIPPQPYFDQSGSASAKQTYLQIHTPLGSYFVLPAHQTVLGATLEFIKMPFDLAGEILTKSSVARTFMVIGDGTVDTSVVSWMSDPRNCQCFECGDTSLSGYANRTTYPNVYYDNDPS